MRNICILLFFLFFSCTQIPEKHDKSAVEIISNTELELDSNSVDTNEVAEQDTATNIKDAQGRKQGKWVTFLYGKPWKVDFYKNNKLHGQCYEYLANGEVLRTDYINGKRYGYYLHYQPDSTVARFVVYYQNDTAIWHGFPSELVLYFIPIKGFSSEIDSVYVKVPYVSGNLMYEGWVKNDSEYNTHARGLHKLYYETGQLKAWINYSEDSIIVYNKKMGVLKLGNISRRKLTTL